MKALDILNKIKWDKSEKPEETFVFYYDRVSGNLVKIPFESIKEIGKSFITIEKEGEEVEIPIHRIKEIRINEKLIWSRSGHNVQLS